MISGVCVCVCVRYNIKFWIYISVILILFFLENIIYINVFGQTPWSVHEKIKTLNSDKIS